MSGEPTSFSLSLGVIAKGYIKPSQTCLVDLTEVGLKETLIVSNLKINDFNL